MPCGSAKDSNQHDKNGDSGHCAFQDLDHSILEHSFNLGVTNVRQILKCLQNGSKEIKDIILNECNVIYECKVCANLFRSLANFLYHKRCYCKKHLCEEMRLFENFEEEMQTVVVHPEAPEKTLKGNDVLPAMVDCTVDLVKTDVSPQKNAEKSEIKSEKQNGTKEKVTRSKGSKIKDPVEDNLKKSAKGSRTESPMISRRTREKNSMNASKRALKDSSEAEPLKKSAKSTSKNNSVSKISPETVKKIVDESDSLAPEPAKEIENPVKESSGVEMETVGSAVPAEMETVGSAVVVEEVQKGNEISETDAESDDQIKPIESSKEMFVKPLKKVITIPQTVDLKNSSVFDNIRKNLNSNKIGFTNISNATGKNLHCFPKIIFKTIDGNPHAVFQTTETRKPENITLQTKFESCKVANNPENEKLIIVLKKEATSSATDPKALPEKSPKPPKTQNEFHLTRRKRLLARNDCNVQELKCLTCNTQFTSLKTLYFHMLSIHSKKRLYYPCPFCKTLFVQMYGVTRHLLAIHNKTKEQINKLRDVIKKKSIWKKVDDVSIDKEEISPVVEPGNVVLKDEPIPQVQEEDTLSKVNGAEGSVLKTVIKLSKNVTLHKCSKCNRVFGRKSSQVSHEKFCIMNAIKVETLDLAGGGPISPPPNVSFLSLSPKKENSDHNVSKITPTITQPPSDIKVSVRPKRGAEKQMHKDFVNSQTLKWRSVNRVDTKTASSTKRNSGKNLEKKILNIMDVKNLTCLKCGKNFSSFSNLRRHVAIHVGWTRFKCKQCEYQAYNKSQCWAHVQKAHGVADEDLDKAIVYVGGNALGKKGSPSAQDGKSTKRSPEVKIKQLPAKMNGIPKVKITRKRLVGANTKSFTKKTAYILKKGGSENKRDKSQDSKRETNDAKREKSQNSDSKKEVQDAKRDKGQSSGSRRDSLDGKRDKGQNIENKKEVNSKKERVPNLESKEEIMDIKKERSNILGPFFKYSVSDYKKEASNYKSLTTSNPTTIILSKKCPSSTVQSIVTVTPESMSSSLNSKTFPLRSSVRKGELKSPEESKLTTLVTRSAAYSKSSPLPIRMTVRSNSVEEIKKTPPTSPEKTYGKKDRLISEWFPKKDLNSNSSRRESAPLIIGLVPASTGLSVRAKSPVISYERNN